MPAIASPEVEAEESTVAIKKRLEAAGQTRPSGGEETALSRHGGP